MLEVNQLSKWYGPLLAVDDINFIAEPGEIVGFLGPNGAGKSTTMKMISGFLTPSRGTAKICDKDIIDDPVSAKQHLGYLPEGAPAYGEMTVASFLSFITELRGLRGTEKIRAMDDIIEKVFLEPVFEQKIDTLSKGYKRRVGLAQAFVHNPKVLILDEPTDGLDPNQKQEVRQLISDKSKDATIILSTHILEEVTELCDRVIVVARGKIIADCTPEDLAARSALHNAVQIKLASADPDNIENAFLSLQAVKRVEIVENSRDNFIDLILYPNSSKEPLVNHVHGVVTRHDWKILDLTTHKGHLDEVFQQMTKKYQSVS